jgi:hypothetical protein
MSNNNTITLEKKIPWPPFQVFSTLRDHPAELARYIRDVDTIALLKKQPQGRGYSVVTRWQGYVRGNAEKFGFTKDEVAWNEEAFWDSENWQCTWVDHPAGHTPFYQIQGTMQFSAVPPNSTNLRFEARLEVYTGQVPHIPGMLKPLLGGVFTQTMFGTMSRVIADLPSAVENYLKGASRPLGAEEWPRSHPLSLPPSSSFAQFPGAQEPPRPKNPMWLALFPPPQRAQPPGAQGPLRTEPSFWQTLFPPSWGGKSGGSSGQ